MTWNSRRPDFIDIVWFNLYKLIIKGLHLQISCRQKHWYRKILSGHLALLGQCWQEAGRYWLELHKNVSNWIYNQIYNW